MICPNCGMNNTDDSIFCIKCGKKVKETQQLNSEETNYAQVQIQQESTNAAKIQDYSSVNNVQVQTQQLLKNNINKNTNEISFKYFKYILFALLKPFESFKEEETKLCNTKVSLVFSLIISVLMMLVALFKNIITTVFSKTLDYSTFNYKTNVDFSRLKDLDWISLIGKNLLIFIGMIVAIAFIYYIVSLIFKKSVNFIKVLSISSTSLIPYIVFGMVMSPLIGLIWKPLSVIMTVIGIVYSFLILVNLMNKDLTFDNEDKKIYFHLICLAIIGSAGYYLYIKLMTSAVSNNINDILNMFK